MGTTSLRVMLASGQPEILRSLQCMIEQKFGGVVVGKGENGINAVRLARRLRPDMAFIDSQLPYNICLKDVPLSCNAGLDAAQAISAEIPNVRVVLFNADSACSPENAMLQPSFAGTDSPMTWPDSRSGVAFASLRAGVMKRERSGFSDICITISTCALLFGLVLTTTMFLAYAGLPLIALGIAGLITGCIGKLVWTRSRQTGTLPQARFGSGRE